MEMDADANLWYFTALSSSKIAEAQQHRQVCVSYMRPDKQDYLSISGSAQVVRDKDRMRRLWSAWIEPWFPRGLDDPDLVLLKITVAEAEYWDAPGGAVRRLAGLAKGIISGDTSGLGEHGRVPM
jgi:general stress protein 26